MRNGLETGDVAPEFSLIGADGMIHTLVDYRGFKGTCFCFFKLECEASINALDELSRLQKLYKQKSIAFVGVCIKQDETFRETLKALKVLDMEFDLLVDGTGDLKSKFDVSVVPHAFIFNQSKHLIYSGSLQSSNSDENFAANALDQLIGGLPITKPWTEPKGSEVNELSLV